MDPSAGEATPHSFLDLIERGLRRFPWITEARVEQLRSREELASRDGLPIVGADPSVKGLYWLTGFGGWGISLAPGAAELLRDCLDGSGTIDAALDPARYAGRANGGTI